MIPKGRLRKERQDATNKRQNSIGFAVVENSREILGGVIEQLQHGNYFPLIRGRGDYVGVEKIGKNSAEPGFQSQIVSLDRWC